MAGATWNCCRPGGNSVYTTQLCTSRLQCHFIQSDIGKMHVFLAVICHLHFWQNDRDLLRATAVTHGWNGYRNKSRHRKLTLEKFILSPLLRGLEPGTFRSRVRRSNHWAILLDVFFSFSFSSSFFLFLFLSFFFFSFFFSSLLFLFLFFFFSPPFFSPFPFLFLFVCLFCLLSVLCLFTPVVFFEVSLLLH